MSVVQKLVNGLDPKQVFQGVPSDEDFEEQDVEFILSQDIKDIANLLIEEALPYLKDVRIEYFWKKRGGSAAGKLTLGKCQKPSGLLKKYCPGSFVIWLGADNVVKKNLTRYQVEALIFHELNHIDLLGDSSEAGYDIKGHDFEGFGSEIERYGLWEQGLQVAGDAVQSALGSGVQSEFNVDVEKV